ncbi:alcohol dehydrogenase catalytic domain-containing protein, partial [Streptomyces sp. NPDC059917]|uniref:SpnB-like Rossmann fold domain-containing protein n=1 Tax=Streptomyces sp. NPDC059917 TaxID=3347002 RepID=UPI0036687174
HATLTPTTPTTINITLTDPTGTPTLTIDELTLRPVSAEQLRGGEATGRDSLFGVDWVALGAGAGQSVDGLRAAVIGDARSASAVVLGAGASVHGDLDALLAGIDAGDDVPDVVFLDCPASGPDPVEATHRAVAGVLGVVQQWVVEERFAAARLVVVTRGAQAARLGEGVTDLAGAAVWGLVRTAQTEVPDCFTLVDLDGDHLPDAAELWSALGSGESQLAVRDGESYGNRLVRVAGDAVLVPPADTPGWHLGSTGKGTLENVALTVSPTATATLAAGDVRVAVRAVGLNFRDVLIALGSYPGEAPLGSEAAGVVLETGSAVTGFAPGDRVMGLFENGGGPVAVTDHRTLVRVPDGWSFAQAAATPIVFLTAYYGLVDLAGLAAGERLLVHAAAGGVGMA